MKRILSLLILLPFLAFGQQNSVLQKGLIFHLPMSEWSTQPGANLVTNGTFDAETTGWTAGGSSTLSVESQSCKVTNGSGYGYGYQAITTVSGKTYQLTIKAKLGTGTAYYVLIGTTAGGSQLYSSGAQTNTVDVVYSIRFQATGSTSYISVNNATNTAGHTSFFDNVVVREINVFCQDLITGTQGTITDAYPVMGKDGSGRREYIADGVNDKITIPDNDNYDFGTGDFSVRFRCIYYGYTNQGSVYNILMHKGDVNVSFTGWSVGTTSDNKITFFVNGTGAANTAIANSAILNQWMTVVAVRERGTLKLYINGTLQTDTGSESNTVSNATGVEIWGQSGRYARLDGSSVGFFNRALSAAEVLAYQNDHTPLTFADRGATNTELVTNGSFTTDTGWTKNSGWTISSGTANYDAVSNDQTIYQSLSITAGKKYRVSFTVSTGTFRVGFIDNSQTYFIFSGTLSNYASFTTGSYSYEVTANYSSTQIRVIAKNSSGGTACSIDNLSITPIGNTLNLTPAGMNSTYWYDYDHSVSGTVSGATLSIPTASNLGAYAFNGTTSAIAYSGMNGLTGDISMSFWAYWVSRGENAEGTIFDNGYLRLVGTTSGLAFDRDGPGGSSVTQGFNVGQWYHVAVTSPASGTSIWYVNGVAANSGTAGTPVSGTTYYVGNRAGSDRTTDGRISDLRIYNRILPTEEITMFSQGIK